MTILTERINTLTRDYNERIGAMKSTFNLESSTLRYSDKRKLKRDYSNRYNDLAREYQAERGQLFEDYAEEHPEWTKSRRLWGWIFALGAVFAVVCCGASMPSDDTPQPAVVSRLAENAEEVYWNADNIPIPYLQDSTQYVSNPDHVLSQEAVDVINVNMKRIEQEFDIQSVVIVVNHVENDDPFRMAQDVGNRYGVGRNDRGLLIVVGYGDHKINISPGRSLEGDLTDAECRRLQQQYVIPGMKAEMPDSAMVYLSEGLYAHFKGKEMPQMSSLYDSDDDSAIFGSIGLCVCFLIGWFIFFIYKNKEYHWIASSSLLTLAGNPFVEVVVGSGGGYHSSGGFGGGGGGFSGGSFGGGSFGGGGATSSW